MKKYSFLIMMVAAICLATSCSKKQKSREERVKEFRAELTTEDTTAMLRLCDDAMEQLKAKKIDQVLASLYEYIDSPQQIKPLSKEMENTYRKRFKTIPVLDYKRVYYSFMLEECNDVKYEVTFATAEQIGSDKPATTMFMFNPIKIDGEWKLCLKTGDDEIDVTKN